MSLFIRVVGVYNKDIAGNTQADPSYQSLDLVSNLELLGILAIPTLINNLPFSRWRQKEGVWLLESEHADYLRRFCSIALKHPQLVTHWEKRLEEKVDRFTFLSESLCSHGYCGDSSSEILTLMKLYVELQSLIWGIVLASDQYVDCYKTWLSEYIGNHMLLEEFSTHFLNTLIPMKETLFSDLWVSNDIKNQKNNNRYLDVIGPSLPGISLNIDLWSANRTQAKINHHRSVELLSQHLPPPQRQHFLLLIQAIQIIQNMSEQKNRYYFDAQSKLEDMLKVVDLSHATAKRFLITNKRKIPEVLSRLVVTVNHPLI